MTKDQLKIEIFDIMVKQEQLQIAFNELQKEKESKIKELNSL